MHKCGQFRLLVSVFYSRFLENDTVSPGSGFQTNIYQITGFLIASGWFISYFLVPSFLKLSSAPPTEQADWTVHTLRMLFTAYSFGIVGFATVFQWDMLFPDRRDFLVLGPLPVRLYELLAARVAALALLLLLLVAAINVFPVLMMIALSILVPALHGSGARLVVAQLAATGAASLFALIAVAAFQGLLVNVLTPRIFNRVSPWIQMFGMSGMVLCVLLYPIYSLLLKHALDSGQSWPWLLPPVWFAGVYDLILPIQNARFVSLGSYGVTLLGSAAVVALVTWGVGYRRYHLRTLEAEESFARSAAWTWPTWLTRLAEERAITAFSTKTLSRSRKHRLFLATYISVGLSFASLFALAVRAGKLVVSEDGMRAFPFLVTFFVISGFRAVCQFPAELSANWMFQLTEAEWAEAARRAVRKHAVIGALIPTVAIVMPLEILMWGLPNALLHGAFQVMTGALLIEAVFWTFDKVPFTCSYFPANLNLSMLAGMYLYGFTSYSFHLAGLERVIERHGGYQIATFVTGGALLTLCWLRRRPATKVRFAAEEPLIQRLDLT
ncbi:MAG TPA: hypothetical protein VEQ63_09770 [Bryobacteraceae bacterium]|nr:hypothetical protein [Bryobacteraceae bacterium]